MALQLRDHAIGIGIVCARRFNPLNCHGDWRLRGVLVLLMPVVVMIITTTTSLTVSHSLSTRLRTVGSPHPCLSTMLERDSLAVLPAAAAESVGLAAEAAAGGRAVELRAPGPDARLLPVPVLRATLRRPTLRARSALALHITMFARNPRP